MPMRFRAARRLNRIALDPGDLRHEIRLVSVLKRNGVPVEVESALDTPWGRNTQTWHRLGAGKSVHWARERFGAEVRYPIQEDAREQLFFIFALEGGWRDVLAPGRRPCERTGGQVSVLLGRGFVRQHCLPGGPDAVSRHLCLAVPVAEAERWFDDDEAGPAETPGASRLRRLLRGEGPPHLTLPFGSASRTLLAQITACPFEGIARTLFIEARCNDLVVEVLAALASPAGKAAPAKAAALRPGHLDAVRRAAALLDAPQSVSVVTRQEMDDRNVQRVNDALL
ncbi:MAG TPA: hypothetical protein VIM58_10645, partial [Candidatus Methylacidiphilales bacterium]